MLQLDSFQTELTNAVSQRVMCQSVIFLIFFNFSKKKIKNATCQVPVCEMWHCQCHVALSVPRVSVTVRCHCVDFDLVPIYIFLFQFGTHLCISDSILFQFF